MKSKKYANLLVHFNYFLPENKKTVQKLWLRVLIIENFELY